jgi:hypothetical protein
LSLSSGVRVSRRYVTFSHAVNLLGRNVLRWRLDAFREKLSDDASNFPGLLRKSFLAKQLAV